MPKYITWIPTQPGFIGTFFEICPVTKSDVVYDLGSGDGRLLFMAIEKGAGRCVGVEIDPDLVKMSRDTASNMGLDKKVIFIESDVMDVDLSEATVVLCYLLSAASADLKPKFEKELKPGTRVVMEAFPVPGWKPENIIDDDYTNFFLYTMPLERK
jgi:ribosomal protein L11 methylase PrmA